MNTLRQENRAYILKLDEDHRLEIASLTEKHVGQINDLEQTLREVKRAHEI